MLGKSYDVMAAENGVIGIEYARHRSPDLILLDVMLPVLSGHDACSLLKQDERTQHIPIIFLSAKNSVQDITAGLAQGADDYVGKPFDFKELEARIRTRIERARSERQLGAVHIGDLFIDPALREVSYSGKTMSLTLTEFDILKCLARKAGQTVSREEILREVWRDDSPATNDRTIDVHIRSLRRKIPALTKHILSIYGVGYKYDK